MPHTSRAGTTSATMASPRVLVHTHSALNGLRLPASSWLRCSSVSAEGAARTRPPHTRPSDATSLVASAAGALGLEVASSTATRNIPDLRLNPRHDMSVRCPDIGYVDHHPLVVRLNKTCLKCHARQTACSWELELKLLLLSERTLWRLMCPRIPLQLTVSVNQIAYWFYSVYN